MKGKLKMTKFQNSEQAVLFLDSKLINKRAFRFFLWRSLLNKMYISHSESEWTNFRKLSFKNRPKGLQMLQELDKSEISMVTTLIAGI
jgi:hypothetical protein